MIKVIKVNKASLANRKLYMFKREIHTIITTITTQIIIDHMIELQEKTIILITHNKDLVKINVFIVSVMDIGKNNVGKRKTI